MTSFQLLGVGFSAFAALLTLAAVARRRISRRAGLLWATVWTAAGAFIVAPQITVWLARSLGIARGADLVFYCAILAGTVGFFVIYVRLRRLEANLTRLVRHLAIENAVQPAPPTGGDEPAVEP